MSLDKEQLNDFIEDIKLLATKLVIEHTELNNLKQLLKTGNIKEYLDIVPQVKPESAMSDKIITPLLEALDIKVSPQVNTGSSWVDYAISTAFRNPVGLEVKPMFVVASNTKLKINKLDDIFDNLKNSFAKNKKNQITLYLRKYDYIIFTNGVDVLYFNRDAIASFNYFYKETFVELVERITTSKNVYDVIAKIEADQLGEKKDLDKEFFYDLKKWYTILGDVKWKGDENEINRIKIALLDKLIFVQTLEDYSLVPFKIMTNKFEDNEQMWKTKGSRKVVEEFMNEIDNWFYTYYDTELFKENILEHLEESEENYSKFLEILKWIIGLEVWETVFKKGLGHYNYRYIDEDIFGKAYETFLAENRKEEGIYYTPRSITDYMAENVVNEVFKENKNKLIELLNHNPTEEEFEEAKQISRRLTSKGIIDIASGSGSFLIKVLRKIYGIYEEINRATEWAIKGAKSFDEPDDVIAFIKKVLEIRNIIGIYGASSALKRRLVSLIILRHIYGIDLDKGAVEVAKTNLWKEAIKLNPDVFRFEELKGETNHVLPNLTTNLIHGNSILTLPEGEIIEFIGENFKNEIAEMIRLRDEYLENPEDPTSIEKIALIKEKIREELGKKFDTNYPVFYPLEFPQFYFDENGSPLSEQERGFNGMIGNPPYVKEYTNRMAFDDLRDSPYYQGKMDIWYLFACKGIDLLKKDIGILAFIAQNNWVTSYGASKMRNKVLEDTKIVKLIDFGSLFMFENSDIQTMIMIFQKTKQNEKYEFELRRVNAKDVSFKDAIDMLQRRPNSKIEYLNPVVNKDCLLNKSLTFSNTSAETILEKIQKKTNFYFDGEKDIAQGIVPNPDVISANGINKISPEKIKRFSIKIGDGVFVTDTSFLLKVSDKEKDYLKPLFEPQQLAKYFIPSTPNKLIIYLTKNNEIEGLENLIKHLEKYKEIMEERRENRLGRIKFYHLHWAREEKFFTEGPKILSIRKCKQPTFIYTEMPTYVMMAINIIKTDRINLKYLTALLNSKLIAFWLKHKGKMQGNNYQIDKEPLLSIPLINISEPARQPFIDLVDQILSITQKEGYNPKADTKDNKKAKDLENQIDQLVYKLYGLTDDEIKTIEGRNETE
jgi:hypothetical protein